jgi:AraC-like DNA-binding protein
MESSPAIARCGNSGPNWRYLYVTNYEASDIFRTSAGKVEKQSLYYQQVQPNPILASFIQCYWAIGADAQAPPPLDHGVIPGGYTDFVFNIGDQIQSGDSDSVFFDKTRSFVAGPFDRFLRLRAQGQFESLGVRFNLGKAPFFSILPLRALRNCVIPLDTIWADRDIKAEINALELHLAHVEGIGERISCVERFLMKRSRHWKEPDAIVTQAVGLIEESQGQIEVKALAASLQISGRRLERKFERHVGLSPKAFCRVTRFRQTKSLLEQSGELNGCDLAYACGYYDQTHLIHEFRLLTGQTPVRYESVRPVGFFLYGNHANC